jgi:hypothetical protein
MTDMFDIDSGVLGLEAIWTWSVGSFVLNDQAAKPEWFVITRVTGLFDGPDHESPADKRVGRIGENFRPASAGGKTIVIEGEARSLTIDGLRTMCRGLRGAFAPQAVEGVMAIAPNAAVGGPTGGINCRPIALQMDEVQATQTWRRPFILSLRASDPRVYFPSLAVDETGSSSVSVTNDGSAPADPVVTITGASGAVTLSDGTRTLTWADVPSGTLIVDFAKRTAKVGTDHAPLVVASSDWWDSFVDGIAPGATVTIAQTGGTGIEVQFTPAVW